MSASQVRYADLWALLRQLGFDCDTVVESNHRICEHQPTETRIVLHNYPPEQLIREQILRGVQMQLAGRGFMEREDFNAWVARRTKANARANGPVQRGKTRRRTTPS